MDGPQAVNVTFAKQVPAFHHLFDELFKADALPFTFATFTDALHRLQNSQRAVQAFEQGCAAGAGSRTRIKTAFARQLFHRRGKRNRRINVMFMRQWVVGVARNAQNFPRFAVDADPHTALGPAAEALGHGDHLLRILLPARLGVGFGGKRIAEDAIAGDFPRGAIQQTVNRALCHIPITQAKGHHPANGETNFKPLTTG